MPPLQSHLSSLSLVRLLQQWVPAPGEPARQDVAQRLGEWLSAFDSVKLDGALQAIASYGASPQALARQRAQPVDVGALAALCRRVTADVTALVELKLAQAASDRASVAVPVSGPTARPVAGSADDPAATAQATAEATAEADYGKHLQRHAELQRQMESAASACRAQVRQALSKASPRLRQLAALDGVMAEMLGEREHKLLAAVPIYLERRFAHWRQLHEDAQAVSGPAADEAQRALPPDGWLAAFKRDVRQTLMAEWQVRLQPVMGLIDAARADTGEQADGLRGPGIGQQGSDMTDMKQA